MCAEYKVRAKFGELQEELGFEINNQAKKEKWDLRVKMTLPAPILELDENGKLQLTERIFPANPFPNARLSQAKANKKKVSTADEGDTVVRITKVPMWKAGFEKFPCVAPLTSFFEPAYWGDHSGEVVEFSDPKHKFLFIAAIKIKPRVPSTGKSNGFALLTHTASDQMLKFHHRLIVCLKARDAVSYLRLGEVTSEERYDFLLQNRYIPKFKTATDRTMAKGWEKRVKQHERSLQDEMGYRKTLANEGIAG